MASRRSVIAKFLMAAFVMLVALAIPAPAAAGPCYDQFMSDASGCQSVYDQCYNSSSWYYVPVCVTQFGLCNDATAAVYTGCIMFGQT
jgi:hypothetical protein